MKNCFRILTLVILLCGGVMAQSDLFHRHSLTGGTVQEFGDFAGHCLKGLSGVDSEEAINYSLDLTQIYQQNVNGGLRTSDDSGRYTMSYDLGIEMDFEKMLGIQGTGFALHAEGSGPEAEGISVESIGDYYGVNGDAGGNYAIELSEAFWIQEFGDNFTVLVGKMDTSATLDTNAYANDETVQFLSSALVNNPQIPIDYALAIQLFYNPSDKFSFAASFADAEGDMGETGFDTAFDGNHYYVYVFEAGYHPEISGLGGSYRLGIWHDTSDVESMKNGRTHKGNTGYYLSLDQAIFVEDDEEQGLGAFLRYGITDDEYNEVENFFSVGLHYHGLVPGRNHDTIGLGMAHGNLSRHYAVEDVNGGDVVPEGDETLYELYYNINVCPWAQITPVIQYVVDPAADIKASDATVIAVRSQIAF